MLILHELTKNKMSIPRSFSRFISCEVHSTDNSSTCATSDKLLTNLIS